MRKNRKKNKMIVNVAVMAILIIAGFLALSLIITLAKNLGVGRVAPPHLCVGGTDNSGRLYGEENTAENAAKTKKRFGEIVQTIVDQQRGTAEVVIYRFASNADRIYNRSTPREAKDVWPIVEKEILKTGREIDDGTLFSSIFFKIIEECAANPTLPAYAFICSDGAADDLVDNTGKPGPAVKAAELLASVSNFRHLLVVPILNDPKTRTRAKLEEALRPLGDKVTIAAEGDQGEAIKKFLKMMKEGK